jgi:hypothetical protein
VRFSIPIKPLEDRVDDSSALLTLTKHTSGRVLRRSFTKRQLAREKNPPGRFPAITLKCLWLAAFVVAPCVRQL